MAITRRPQPAHITWTKAGFTPSIAEGIEKNFRTLFQDMRVSTDLITVDRGGTGLTEYEVGDMLYASDVDELSRLALGSSGSLLRADNTIPAWSTFTIADTFAQGDLIYANATNTLVALAKSTSSTRYLSNTGSSNNPAWAQVSLVTGVTGTLPIANGGTNQTSFTSAGVVYFDGTSLTSGSIFTFNGSTLVSVTTSTGADTGFKTTNTGSGGSDTAAVTVANSLHAGVFFTTTGSHGAVPSVTGIYTNAANGFVFYPNAILVTRIQSSGLTMASGKTITLTGFTAGRVLFTGSTGEIAEDSSLLWDSTNNYLGIGITPAGTLDVSGTFSADQAFGFRQQVVHNTATAGTVYGGQFNATVTHSSGTMNNAVGLTNAARFGATANASNMTGEQCFVALTGASPTGTITTSQNLNISTISNFATGTPAVTISQARGLIIGDIGSGNGSNGLTVTNSCAMSIAGSQTASTNSAVINISNTTSVPFAPSGTWSVFNASTRNNHWAGPFYMGHTTTWSTGTNFISFADGTIPGTPASNTAAIYADDVNGTVNMFAINEASVTDQLTGLAIRKTADESVANNTIQADDHLTVNLMASSSYAFEIYGFYTNAATPGIKVQVDGTAGVSSLKADVYINAAAGAAFGAFARITAFNSAVGLDTTGDNSFVIKGVIEVSTAGTLFLEWAQNTTDAGNSTTLQENSFMVLRKLNA